MSNQSNRTCNGRGILPADVQTGLSSKADELDNACMIAMHQLEALLTDDRQHCPHFLPRCKAVILCSSVKAGFGVALQLGSGVLLARLPDGGTGTPPAQPALLDRRSSSKSAELPSPKCDSPCSNDGEDASGLPSPCSPCSPCSPRCRALNSQAWSPPCFVSVAGLSAGFTAGAHRATHLIGVMSDAALERIAQGGTLALGAEWNLCLLESNSDAASALTTDLCVASLTSGLMVDVNASAVSIRVDGRRNRRVYGTEVSATDLLHGLVPLPPVAGPLVRRLSHAEGVAVAAAFEPSYDGSEAGPRLC